MPVAEKHFFGYDMFMKHLIFLTLFITFCLPVYAEEIDGKAYLKKGKNELESKNYKDAIASLSEAEKEFPLLGDYALLWLSDAYHENGDHKESLKTTRILLKKYPRSPLVKKSRSREMREAEEVSEENIDHLYETYVKDYPGDTEMRYLYAEWLKKNGKKDKAKSIFKDIYVEAGSFSEIAYSELSPSDIRVEDMIKRASNLIKMMDYKNAESALRSALAKDDGSLRDEILKDLGLSLFKQKKYLDAARVYKKARERYWEVRSLYRAGEKEAVHSALDTLLQSKDKRFGSLLIALASDKRRDGNIEEALRIYQIVMEQFHSDSEDALWGVGWTYFLTGEYTKATDIFTRLYGTYNDPKYLYWKARSIEAAGEDASKIYPASTGRERAFYNVMSYVRTKGHKEQSSIADVQKFVKTITPVKGTPLALKKIERIEALLDLGLSKEALSEMILISKNTDSLENILYICSKFLELGEYKHVVRSAVKVPYNDELHHFLYPLAYRGIVEDFSGKYNIDPLLVLSIIREESRFDSEARSPAGALGLMQLMPQTAYRLNTKLKLGINSSHDIFNVKNNLHAGIYYLSHLMKEFGSYAYALAVYNAGEEVVKKWLQKGSYKSVDEFIEDIPYSETRNYVKRVLTTFFEYKRASATADGIIEIPVEKL